MTRPEHLHYDKVEAWFRESIAQGRAFLFDTTLFDIELRRLWEEYNFPYEVCFLFAFEDIRMMCVVLCRLSMIHDVWAGEKYSIMNASLTRNFLYLFIHHDCMSTLF
jgi:hypothetical protein